MNVKLETDTAESHEVGSFQATDATYTTRIEILQTEEQCVAIAEVYALDPFRRARKTSIQPYCEEDASRSSVRREIDKHSEKV